MIFKKSKNIDEILEDRFEELKALQNTPIYPGYKKEAADEILVNLIFDLVHPNDYRKVQELIEIYQEIKPDY